MEWAVWTASSDSEGATTREINEEEGAPPNRDRQDSLYGAGEQSSTKDAHGSVDLTSVEDAASTRNGWDSMVSVTAEAGKKSPDKDSDVLTPFKISPGNRLAGTHCMGCTSTVSISEGAGIPDNDPVDLTMKSMREDEEQALVTEEDLGESAKELECDSSTARRIRLRCRRRRLWRVALVACPLGKKRRLRNRRRGVLNAETLWRTGHKGWIYLRCRRPRLWRVVHASSSLETKRQLRKRRGVLNVAASWQTGESSENLVSQKLPRKKRKRTEVGHGQPSKLVKRSERPQEKQMPGASTECGDNATDPSYWSESQNAGKSWCESCQCRHLEGIHAAREPFICAENKETFIHSLKLVEHQEVHAGEKHHCAKCNITCKNSVLLNSHCLMNYSTEKPFKCPVCNKHFVTADGMSQHQLMSHNVEKPYRCTECNLTFNSILLRNQNRHTAHVTEESFQCLECNKLFTTADSMSQHRLMSHNVEKPFQCTKCNLTFNNKLDLSIHNLMTHGKQESFRCPECNKHFVTADGMSQHRLMSHNVEKPFQCTECNLTFNRILLRNQHRHTAHGTEESFQCPECNKLFTKADGMSQHRLTVHNV